MINSKTVQDIAKLARIGIDPSALEKVTADLSLIFDRMQALANIDTTGIVPLAHPHEMTQPLRADVVSEQDQHQLLQELTPHINQQLYLVPVVID